MNFQRFRILKKKSEAVLFRISRLAGAGLLTPDDSFPDGIFPKAGAF